MRLQDLVPVMRSMGVKSCELGTDDRVMRCELFESEPRRKDDTDRPESEEDDEHRRKREREDFERILYAASEGT